MLERRDDVIGQAERLLVGGAEPERLRIEPVGAVRQSREHAVFLQ